jgi:hypothetical protein
MTPLDEAIRRELEQIEEIVEEIVGARSRWNGVVELVAGAEFRGRKPFSCAIQVSLAVAQEETRWRTLIHEMLHAVSAGYARSEYLELRGWEEGVVEQLQRLVRPSLLERLNVEIPEERFRAIEEKHPFNRHIEALEQLRQGLGQAPLPFYLALLRTPLRDRPTVVFEWYNQLPTGEQAALLRIFGTASAVLRTR